MKTLKNNNNSENLIHSLDGDAKDSKNNIKTNIVLAIVAGAIVLGIGTGFATNKIFAGKSSSAEEAKTKSVSETDSSGQKTSAGILDKDTFNDTATGMLKEGGFEGEGSFHLERPGGEDQNVYLTSSTVDLSEFLEKEVTVWGKTFDAEKAGWLMDVGYIELKK